MNPRMSPRFFQFAAYSKATHLSFQGPCAADYCTTPKNLRRTRPIAHASHESWSLVISDFERWKWEGVLKLLGEARNGGLHRIWAYWDARTSNNYWIVFSCELLNIEVLELHDDSQMLWSAHTSGMQLPWRRGHGKSGASFPICQKSLVKRVQASGPIVVSTLPFVGSRPLTA